MAAWEIAAHSGLFYQRVVPSSLVILPSLARQLADPAFYFHLSVTTGEVIAALAIGGIAGLLVGLAIGYSRGLSAALEPILYYLAPTPKIVFLPILLMAFGVGPSSKVAVGALSAFFPIAMSTVAGMREVSTVHLDVGRSFRLSRWQMVIRVYLPSLRVHLVTGVRLGLGLAVIGVMLAETKLSNRGIGFLAIQYYNSFRTPELYAILLVVFAMTSLLNIFLERLERRRGMV
jgi:ABC-type nitrate/sulfonate/bicarbonate transport system permease component